MDKKRFRRLIKRVAEGLAKVVHATDEATSVIDEAYISMDNLNYQLHQYYLEKQVENSDHNNR